MNDTTADLISTATRVTSALRRRGLRPRARVCETTSTTDLVFTYSRARFVVVRCVGRRQPQDYTALATMIAQGDFVWAGLVYDEEDEAGLFSPIESFHVSELDRLVARLREVEACGR